MSDKQMRGIKRATERVRNWPEWKRNAVTYRKKGGKTAMMDKTYPITEDLQIIFDAADLMPKDEKILLTAGTIKNLIERIAAAEGQIAELQAENAFLKSEEAWKRVDSLSQSVNDKTLTISQMSIERGVLQAENERLKAERKVTLEAVTLLGVDAVHSVTSAVLASHANPILTVKEPE